jgi:hypothetical protein
MPSSGKTNAILISHRVGLTTAIPYARTLCALGEEVRIYCLGDFLDQARSLAPDGVDVVGRGGISVPRRARALKMLTYALSSFDPGANPGQRQTFDHRRRSSALIRRWASWLTRRVSPNRLNSLMRTFGGLGCRPLSEPRVWVVSFLTEPSLVLGRGQRVITLMDSWDHPVRRTAGYRTDAVIGWNRPLALDWATIQGSGQVIDGAPLKLRYAAERCPLESSGNRRFMFAVGTSSHTPVWQEAELHLAELVCAAADAAEWKVVLKLKPIGGQEDWLEFADRHPNVEVTDEVDALGPMDYFLDDAYNDRRLAQLASVEFVLNTVTTFGLDAACAGVPVLQLCGLEGPRLQGLASAQRNYHISKYLLKDERQLFRFTEADGVDSLAAWLRQPDDRASKYSEDLRRWLLPAEGFEASLRSAVSTAMGIPA